MMHFDKSLFSLKKIKHFIQNRSVFLFFLLFFSFVPFCSPPLACPPARPPVCTEPAEPAKTAEPAKGAGENGGAGGGGGAGMCKIIAHKIVLVCFLVSFLFPFEHIVCFACFEHTVCFACFEHIVCFACFEHIGAGGAGGTGGFQYAKS